MHEPNLISQSAVANRKTAVVQELSKKLKKLGDEIELLSRQLKESGEDQKSNSLYSLGNQIEHFLDDVNLQTGKVTKNPNVGTNENSQDQARDATRSPS